MSARVQVRIPQGLKAKLEQQAANEGKTLPEYLKDHLPELAQQGIVDVGFTDSLKQEPFYVGKRELDPLDDYVITLKKMAVARMFQGLAASAMPFSPEDQLQRFGKAPKWATPKNDDGDKFTTKDMMDRLTVFKMISSLEGKKDDPGVQAILKELKDAQIKSMEDYQKLLLERTKKGDGGVSDIKDMMQWVTFYRMAGQPEQAKTMQEMLNKQINEMTGKLHETQMSMVKAQSEWRQEDLQRQIDEIKNAPSEFDQITRMSELSHRDPAIKAYLNKKLGIAEKGELTPEKLKGYIESIQVPVGDIIKGVYGYIQQRGKAPARPPPPPIVEPPSKAPPTPSPPPTPPEEAHLPMEARVPTESIPVEAPIEPTRGRGRPKGSKNKPKEVAKSE